MLHLRIVGYIPVNILRWDSCEQFIKNECLSECYYLNSVIPFDRYYVQSSMGKPSLAILECTEMGCLY